MSDSTASILAATATLQHINIAFLVVASIPTFLRLYVRGVLTRTFGVDDWAMVACYVSHFPQPVERLDADTIALAMLRRVFRNGF